MGEQVKRICTICARGGSEGVPGKNTRSLLGKPLIEHTIDHALDAGIFDCVAVSSDDPDILRVADACGVNEVIDRPSDLATSKAAKLPAIQHAVSEVQERHTETFATVVDLDATSPVRKPEDIQNAVELF